jgi:hypothetical protein
MHSAIGPVTLKAVLVASHKTMKPHQILIFAVTGGGWSVSQLSLDWTWRPDPLASKCADLTPLNFFLWVYVKIIVYGSAGHVDSMEELKHWITAAIASPTLVSNLVSAGYLQCH